MAFQIDITNADTWRREVLEVPGTLQVIELYQTWCGPCKAIQSTFKRVYFDAGDKPLKFYTVSTKPHLNWCIVCLTYLAQWQ